MTSKKKIGCVIAYNPGHNNYGTSLQGYATIKKIQDLGYECEVIRYVKQLSLMQKVGFVVNAIRAGYAKVLFERVKSKSDIKKYPHLTKGNIERTKSVDAYKSKKLIPLFKEYIGYNALCEGSSNYAAIVVGSDQVWTPLGLYNKYFNLLFAADNVPKISYASSFGVSEIPNFQKHQTGAYLDRFSYIGVREQRGKEIVDTLSNKTAQVVVDPTMLLTQEEWREEISDSSISEKEPYIFVYLLGNNPKSRAAVNELKEKTGYKIITIPHMEEYIEADEQFGDEAPYGVDPNDFVKYISEAAYVCTDSFHCTVFSIIFHRQFMTFYRFAEGSKISRNSRIDSLYSILGINRDRIYTNEICNNIDQYIDYDLVDSNLGKLRDESIEFLSNALKSSK